MKLKQTIKTYLKSRDRFPLPSRLGMRIKVGGRDPTLRPIAGSKFCGQVLSIIILLYLAATFIPPCFADHRPVIAVIKSWDTEPYNTALKGFNKVLKEEGIKAQLFNYDMKGRQETGHRITEEIIAKKPDLVLTLGTRATRIAAQDIKDIPVVFSMVLDPVASGFVKNMKCSGNNMTGASMDIPIKMQFETLKSVLPKLKRIDVLYNKEENKAIINKAKTVAREIGLELVAIDVSSEKDIPRAMKLEFKSQATAEKIDALWMVADKIVFSPPSRRFILAYTLENRIPFMGISSHFVKVGALLALSCDNAEMGRQAGQLTIKILNGGRPTELPVTVPTKTRLSINLKTAKRIGLEIPSQIVDKADEVFK